MRRIGIATCYALVMVLTRLAPASAQVFDFTTIDIPGATATLPRDINPEGNTFGGPGVATADLVYTGCVSGPNIKSEGNSPQ